MYGGAVYTYVPLSMWYSIRILNSLCPFKCFMCNGSNFGHRARRRANAGQRQLTFNPIPVSDTIASRQCSPFCPFCLHLILSAHDGSFFLFLCAPFPSQNCCLLAGLFAGSFNAQHWARWRWLAGGSSRSTQFRWVLPIPSCLLLIVKSAHNDSNTVFFPPHFLRSICRPFGLFAGPFNARHCVCRRRWAAAHIQPNSGQCFPFHFASSWWWYQLTMIFLPPDPLRSIFFTGFWSVHCSGCLVTVQWCCQPVSLWLLLSPFGFSFEHVTLSDVMPASLQSKFTRLDRIILSFLLLLSLFTDFYR